MRLGVTLDPPVRFSGVPVDMMPLYTLPPVSCSPVMSMLRSGTVLEVSMALALAVSLLVRLPRPCAHVLLRTCLQASHLLSW